MTNESAIRWDRDAEGIVTLTMDDPNQRVNTLNELFARSFSEVIDRLQAERDQITGVILTSGKSSFLAGGDLKRLSVVDPAGRGEFLDDLIVRKARMRVFEQFDRPIVAVVAGAALGGGLEMSLLCHHRIALDSPRVIIGLPEATLGLLPGGGGLVRVTRMLGPDKSLPLILSGERLNATTGLELGLIDELVATPEQALERAREWIRANPDAAQPWDRDGDNGAASAAGAPIAAAEPDAPLATRVIVDLVAKSLSQSVDEALLAESEGLTDLVVSDEAKATIGVIFFDTVRVRSRLAKADASAPEPVLVLRASGAWKTGLADALRGKVTVVDFESEESAEATLAGLVADGRLPIEILSPDDAGTGAELEAWLYVDRVGDGGLVLEHVGGEIDQVLPALSKAGVLPIELAPEAGGFGAALQATADLRGTDLRAAALAAQALVDRLAYPEDLDVASVRIGGLPNWTGGAQRWLSRHEANDTTVGVS